jgi:hypothetical protein
MTHFLALRLQRSTPTLFDLDAFAGAADAR